MRSSCTKYRSPSSAWHVTCEQRKHCLCQCASPANTPSARDVGFPQPRHGGPRSTERHSEQKYWSSARAPTSSSMVMPPSEPGGSKLSSEATSGQNTTGGSSVFPQPSQASGGRARDPSRLMTRSPLCAWLTKAACRISSSICTALGRRTCRRDNRGPKALSCVLQSERANSVHMCSHARAMTFTLKNEPADSTLRVEFTERPTIL